MCGPVTLAVEGTTDAAVAKRLLEEAGLRVGWEYVRNGKAALDQQLRGYNRAAQFSCWLVLRDLDRDADCPAALRERLLTDPAVHMRLHVPVRSIEAWLLADSEAISQALSVRATSVPNAPESLIDPKRTLVDLARQSRRKAIREALVPAPGTAKVGPGYGAFLIEYASQSWRPDVAEARSPSLARLRRFLRRVRGASPSCEPSTTRSR